MAKTTEPAVAGLDRETLLKLYERMALIRAFEERFAALVSKGKFSGTGHLYAGQEAVAVGLCAHLSDDDYITSTHRGHGHCIAKGVDVREMMAELYGKATGSCHGKGGSMHIADFSLGMLGANGIVGAGIPLACGAGISIQQLYPGRVAVCFFGDGAANIGPFHEGLNLASIWKLPVVFVCENNLYAESTPVEYHMAADNVADRAAAYRIPSAIVDGQNVLEVFAAAREAIEHARSGAGPYFIEAKTYRYYGHFMGDPDSKYRPKEEVDRYKARDCIKHLKEHMLSSAGIQEADLAPIDEKIESMIDEAVEFGESSPEPGSEEIYDDVFSD